MDSVSRSTRGLSSQQLSARRQAETGSNATSNATAPLEQVKSPEGHRRVAQSSVLQGGDLSSYLHLLSGRQSPPLLYASSGEAEADSNYELPPLLGESEEPSGAEAALSSDETGSAVEGAEEGAEERSE